jgi:hypothetical protein
MQPGNGRTGCVGRASSGTEMACDQRREELLMTARRPAMWWLRLSDGQGEQGLGGCQAYPV